MDEKLLEEIRRQEARAEGEDETEEEEPTTQNSEEEEAPSEVADVEPKPTGQQTLIGFGSDE
jgi:hypothetical protein